MKSVNVKANVASGFKVEVRTSNHLMIVDQPPASGGNDEGPNPLEYLLAALASCIATVGIIVAKQERLVFNKFEVTINGDYDPNVLMGKPSENRAGFAGIKVKVNLDAPKLTEDEKEAFLRKVEHRCPVTDNLLNNTQVEFGLA